MIVSKLKGGLGNQLFQYAVGRQISLRLKSPLILDSSEYTNNPLRRMQIQYFNTNCIYIENTLTRSVVNLFKKLKKFQVYVEKETFAYDKDINKIKWFTQIDGYWQNYNYFLEIKDILKKEFMPKQLDDKNRKILTQIESQQNSVCLHIRRGDLLDPETNKVHGIMNLDYYKRNIDYLQRKVSNLYFFVFSDDIQWAKENIKETNVYFLDFNSSDEAYKDFALMRACKHFIIPNSTLSWWAAWLRIGNGIVIAPKRWLSNRNLELYGNLMPEDWILD